MKRFTIILALTILLIFPQSALAGNFYWGGHLIGSRYEIGDLELTLDWAFYKRQSIDLNKDDKGGAYGAGLLLGYDFGWAGSIPLRLELQTDLTGGQSASLSGAYLTPAGNVYSAEIKGELDIWLTAAETLNLWFDIPVGEFPLKPYLGGSLGVDLIFYDADVDLNPGSSAAALKASRSERGYDLAWRYSFGGGARLPVGKRTFLDFTLRSVKKQDWNIKMSPFDLKFSTRALEAAVGFKYYF